MTNAEKYLKDGVDVDKFVKEYRTSRIGLLNVWLNEPSKITLTEDEKVILKNIDNIAFKTIGRNKSGGLYVRFYFLDEPYKASIFKDNVFQFIKNGEEYEIKELLGE